MGCIGVVNSTVVVVLWRGESQMWLLLDGLIIAPLFWLLFFNFFYYGLLVAS